MLVCPCVRHEKGSFLIIAMHWSLSFKFGDKTSSWLPGLYNVQCLCITDLVIHIPHPFQGTKLLKQQHELGCKSWLGSNTLSPLSQWTSPHSKSLFWGYFLSMVYNFTMPKISLKWGPVQAVLTFDVILAKFSIVEMLPMDGGGGGGGSFPI